MHRSTAEGRSSGDKDHISHVAQRQRDTELQAMVFVVDDDPSMRDAIKTLIRSVGLQVETFGSTQNFLQHNLPDMPSCLVLDIRLPGRSGLEFQEQLARSRMSIPIIFITGHGDIPMSVRAMKAGAIEFLSKPFREQELLDAVRQGIERHRALAAQGRARAQIHERFARLTDRFVGEVDKLGQSKEAEIMEV